jgi:hypothetical protein
MRSDLLSDLAVTGYTILLEGDNIRYSYQKPGNPPISAKLLIDELKKFKAEVVSILKKGSSIVPKEKTQTETNPKTSWPPEVQYLIDWFMTLDTPTEPFYLAPHIRVINPEKFFASLKREIATGPTGPRARMGTLQSDLQSLESYFINKENSECNILKNSCGLQKTLPPVPAIQ